MQNSLSSKDTEAIQFIYFHNTLTKTLQKFIPNNSDEITIYSCGPTIYGAIHLGNSRPIIVFDALISFLRNFYRINKNNSNNINIKYLRNITDIDEKIINKVKDLDIDYNIFINEQIDNFNKILELIQSNTPITCQVTNHINDIIHVINLMIEKDYAYVTKEGNVYFRVHKFQSYKILTGDKRQDIESFSVENEADKEHWEDFALWKKSNNSVITWDSPWSKGIPGWHTECVAMIYKNLAIKIDIHCGGQDLIFPHHDNEIAQFAALTNDIFCNFWLHNGMILVNNKKMSKSLNNFIVVEDIVKNKDDGDVLKYLILSTHYRQSLNFSQKKWEDSVNNVKKIKNFLQINKIIFNKKEYENFIYNIDNSILKELCNDFNTVGCFFMIHQYIKKFNQLNVQINENNLQEKKEIFYTVIFLLNSMALDFFKI